MRRAVFLDRDGVVNRAVLREGKPYPPAMLSELRLLPGVREACRKLREAGFALILITNQPDIARGVTTAQQVADIHTRLQRYLQLDDIQVCPHDDSAHCDCRKPKPGLLLEAARKWDIDLARSFFVDYGYHEQRPIGPYLRVHSLREAANWIVRVAQMGLQYA